MHRHQAGSNSIKNLKLSTLQVVVKSLYPKSQEENKKSIFLHKCLANLHGFENICKLSVAQTFKVMQSKICFKVVFHKHLKFCFYKFAKKGNFYCAISCADFQFFANCAKMLKSPENLKTFVKIFFIILQAFHHIFSSLSICVITYRKHCFLKNTLNKKDLLRHFYLFCLKRFFFKCCFLYVNVNRT